MVDIDSGEFETIPKYELNFGIRYFFFFHLNGSSYQGYLVTLGQATNFW